MKKLSIALSMLLFATSFLTACGNTPAEEKEAPPAPAVEHEDHDADDHDDEAMADQPTLKMWQGKWVSMNNFVGSEAFKAQATLEAKEENVEVASYIKVLENRLKTPITNIEITDNEVLLKDGKDNLAKYLFVEKKMAPCGGDQTEWAIFKANGETPYTFIAFSHLHGEEGYPHFHFKAGQTIEEMFASPENDPTFIEASTPEKVIIEEIFE